MNAPSKATPAMHPEWSPTSRIVIESVYPEIDGGRYPVKRVVGEAFEVWADIFRDGHDVLGAAVRYRDKAAGWREAPMTFFDNDRWRGSFALDRIGPCYYTIEAWTDRYASWRHDVQKKRDAGQNVSLELIEGGGLVSEAVGVADAKVAGLLRDLLAELERQKSIEAKASLLLQDATAALIARSGLRGDLSRYPRELQVYVDRPAARCAAWYEMFPRSQGTQPGKSATFDDCIRRLPEVQAMGFDVLYFVPIHPIGKINRKGRNNAVTAKPGEPGSPYAIGSDEGGHIAVHSELGTLDDFRRLVAEAGKHGMELALDFAIQCAPDHPWVKQHPEWFVFRPDGTVKYAENPPKKYQDIVNVNFYGPHREALWNELRDVLLFWAQQGVKIFRVDNPHTKPVPFWEWVIREVQTRHPDAIFLSEAFTRPKMLKALAKAGFSQSYTYFTWRNFKQELVDYMTELTQTECREYLRPNFFANTPDILPPILQRGGRPAFQMRLVLAATLSSVYGIYNGFELCEGRALPNSEEYADSEKYEFKVWDWNREGHIKDYIGLVNKARRENPALHELTNLRFHPADSDSVLFYGKMTADRSNMVFVAVNLDPYEAHEATVVFPLHDMGVGDDDAFEVEDLLTGERHLWRGAQQRVRLDPQSNPAAIYRVMPFRHVEFREAR
ncbi:alpha-1,4-glucan--maltose-1-phosphate maltosyltransferase [Desertibaculum subflavum]|uniref:alpha-1,4-glucan--maltose-1-phosphate maltosyltransferase n=1 Tax=Desertibaculum subflavum TaxID=2268458 RepID=UPI000E6758BE